MIKQKISDGLNFEENAHDEGEKTPLIERFIMVLILLNFISVVIEPSFTSPEFLRIFRLFELFSVAVFTIEYILRVWTSDDLRPKLNPWKARLIFIVSAMAIIDLVAILPFYLPFVVSIDLRVLRILRLLRISRLLKINRYTNALSVVMKVIHNKKEQLLSSLFLAMMLIVLASILMYNIENAAQPEVFTSIIHAIWWSIATLTSVGYGDIFPITFAGKFLAALISILGVGIVAIPTGIIAAGFTEVIRDDKDTEEQPQKHFCPYCGNQIDNDNRNMH